ncbi:MAG TPA: YHS domain-containing (seleno)protein [Chryseosolibacter sp.]
MRKLVKFLAAAIILCSCQAKSGEVFVTENGAIGGYDPVAYFNAGKPVLGHKRFSADWKNATWYFSSEENRNLFQSAPEKYSPQYGGYCAYGTAEGHKAPTQPDAWTIVNDKLYLNYNTEVRRYWMEDQTRLILKADSNWVVVKSE